MSNTKRRLEQLESGLTPKQAFLIYPQEAQKFDSIKDYFLHLKKQPDNAWPINKLITQVAEGVKQTLKGQPQKAIDRAVRQACRDVLFLYCLHQRVNDKLISEERHHWSQALVLIAGLKSLLREQALENRTRWNRTLAESQMPIPLDSETAAAVEAAQHHHVLTWEILEEGDDLGEWIRKSFVAEGKTPLPEGAYLMRSGTEAFYLKVPTEDEVREQFQDGESYQKFLDGEEYSHGLADVPDTEYNARYEAFVQAIKSMLQEGIVAGLATVPHQFMREAPLVDGDWIDRYTVELAEWGARIRDKGFRLQGTDDVNPLAWHQIIDPATGAEVDAVVTEKLWQQTRKDMAGFPGRTKKIEGRPYLSFAEYLTWRGRRGKGNLKLGMCTGIAVTSWNHWVDEHRGEGVANLAGVRVDKLVCYVKGDE